jgi:hypothetical protein
MDTTPASGKDFEHDAELLRELLAAGQAVGRLPSAEPPAGLAEHTLARLEREGLVARPGKPSAWRWWIRPITHPLARLAAALVLFSALGVLGNVETAERVGRFFEGLIGPRATDRLEVWVDRMLLCLGPDFGRDPREELVNQHVQPRPVRRERAPQGALPEHMQKASGGSLEA